MSKFVEPTKDRRPFASKREVFDWLTDAGHAGRIVWLRWGEVNALLEEAGRYVYRIKRDDVIYALNLMQDQGNMKVEDDPVKNWRRFTYISDAPVDVDPETGEVRSPTE